MDSSIVQVPGKSKKNFRAKPHNGSRGLRRIFTPIVQYEKWAIHPGFPHFPYFRSGQNLSPNLLAPLCGAALNLRHPWAAGGKTIPEAQIFAQAD